MFNHIDIFKFKSTVSESEITAAVSQLGKLQKEIPTMTHFSFGKDCSTEAYTKGYTHAALFIFKDKEGREAYMAHPEHHRIAKEVVAPLLENGFESLIVIDYEY